MANEDFASSIVDRRGQAILIAADIENGEITHSVSARVSSADINEAGPPCSLGNPIPVIQRRFSVPVEVGKFAESPATDDTHFPNALKMRAPCQFGPAGWSEFQQVSVSANGPSPVARDRNASQHSAPRSAANCAGCARRAACPSRHFMMANARRLARQLSHQSLFPYSHSRRRSLNARRPSRISTRFHSLPSRTS